MLWWCSGHLVMMSRSCCDSDWFIFWWCLAYAVMVSQSYCDGVRSCCDGVCHAVMVSLSYFDGVVMMCLPFYIILLRSPAGLI